MERNQIRNIERHLDKLYDTIHDSTDSGETLTALGAISGIETLLHELGYEINEHEGFVTIDPAGTRSNLPDTYAELEYSDYDSPEAVDGSRWDDMNYLRYTER